MVVCIIAKICIVRLLICLINLPPLLAFAICDLLFDRLIRKHLLMLPAVLNIALSDNLLNQVAEAFGRLTEIVRLNFIVLFGLCQVLTILPLHSVLHPQFFVA